MPYRNLISPRPLAILGLAALFAVLAALSVGLDRVHAQATVPLVTTVAIVSDPGPDDTYARGQAIMVSVTFSEAVTVTGTPRIFLEIGRISHLGADYSGAGAATGQLLFSYTVQPDDRDDDGVSVTAYTLELHGGSIQSQDDSTAAILGHSGVHEPGHRVNGASVIFSNIEQAPASDAITVTADSSASLSFRVRPTRPTRSLRPANCAGRRAAFRHAELNDSHRQRGQSQ